MVQITNPKDKNRAWVRRSYCSTCAVFLCNGGLWKRCLPINDNSNSISNESESGCSNHSNRHTYTYGHNPTVSYTNTDAKTNPDSYATSNADTKANATANQANTDPDTMPGSE
jgi:hypothetical protein